MFINIALKRSAGTRLLYQLSADSRNAPHLKGNHWCAFMQLVATHSALESYWEGSGKSGQRHATNITLLAWTNTTGEPACLSFSGYVGTLHLI